MNAVAAFGVTGGFVVAAVGSRYGQSPIVHAKTAFIGEYSDVSAIATFPRVVEIKRLSGGDWSV